MPVYEIYAVKYAGPFTSSGAMLRWMRDWDLVKERAYYIWCLKSPEFTVVVDAGVGPETAAQRDLAGYVNPVESLAAIGVSADKVEHLLLTHIHWDHANGLGLFPSARVYVQKEEYRFWTQDPIARRTAFWQFADEKALDHLARLEAAGRLQLMDGDAEILPGLGCLLAPGHTTGLQAALVDTAQGRAVLGSDCAHTFGNYSEEWPSSLITDLPAWLRTFDKLKAAVTDQRLLFPGHDIAMHRDFPQVAEGVTRLV